jgi:hypothetical protein
MSQEEYNEARNGSYADGPYMNPDQLGKKWVWPSKDQAVQWQASMQENGENAILTRIPIQNSITEYPAFTHQRPAGPAYLVPIEDLGPATQITD